MTLPDPFPGALLGVPHRLLAEYCPVTSSLLFDHPKTFSHWWTFVPVLPAGRNDLQYAVLKRQWADHTMNCLSNKTGQWKLASPRGFYVQQREDHISTVIFHIWAAFPDVSWVSSLLDLWKVPHGQVARVSWSYSWEQKRDTASRPDITDIVLCWEDEQGQAVLVIEAKRPGGKLSEKDLDGGTRYLQMPSIRPFTRKFVVFLVDENDLRTVSSSLPVGTPVTSWQALGRLQARCALKLPISEADCHAVASFIAKHYADLGMPLAMDAVTLPTHGFNGTAQRYDEIRKLGLPSPVERFLIGSEVSFCAREGVMPEPPYLWLAEEPSFIDVVKARSQTTRDREQALWRLPR